MAATSDVQEEILMGLASLIRDDLVDYGDISPAISSILELIQADSAMIQNLEQNLELPLTGDLKMLVSNFRSKYYTRLCMSQKFEPIFCLKDAIFYKHPDVVTTILEARDLPPKEANTALVFAIENQNKDLVNLSLKRGANVSIQALTHAIASGNLEIVMILLNHSKIDLNVALRYASIRGQTHIADSLLKRGADDLDTAMDLAVYYGRTEIVRLLLDYGYNKLDRPLLSAVSIGYKNIVELLVDRGAQNLNEALVVAAKKRDMGIVELLAQKGATNLEEGLNIYQNSMEEIRKIPNTF